MSYNKIIDAAVDAFKQNLTSFCQNSDHCLDSLDENSFNQITHGLMEAAQEAGKAGLCEFLRNHDTISSSLCVNDAFYRYKGTSLNQILTLFGTITIERAMYYNEKEGGEYLFPMDRAIGLDKDDFATLETRDMILFASSSLIPRELQELLKKCSLCHPSRTAIQNIINKDGACMEELKEELAEKVLQSQRAPQNTQAIVASLDGVNVLLREPGKKKGRKNTRPIKNAVLDDNHQSPTSYHNAMVGALSYYGVDKDGKPQRLESLYTARMPEEKAVAFKMNFENMVYNTTSKIDQDGKSVQKILLVDGHLMIKGFARESTVLKPFKKLIDFYHTTEHLSKASQAMYGRKNRQAHGGTANGEKRLKKMKMHQKKFCAR